MSAPERSLARARSLLARPGAWLDPCEGGYRLRLHPDRRRRAAGLVDEAVFAELTRAPGVRPRAAGGFDALSEPGATAPSSPPPGRPGVIEGERTVVEADGRTAVRKVNLGESPVAWLLRRKDVHGRPFITEREAAAAERLREDFHQAALVGRLTQSFDPTPRAPGPSLPGDPTERALAARGRVNDALVFVGPGLREIVEAVCLHGTALEAAEDALHLPRRAGKAVLNLALRRLAAWYRM